MSVKSFFTVAARKLGGKRTVAILLAGGKGERVGGDCPKQFLSVSGVPVLIRSLRAFDESPFIDDIVLVIRKEDQERVRALLKEYPVGKLRRIVGGGETRRVSALHGLEAAGDCAYVAIHDAARCLITPEAIRSVVLAAYGWRAATAASRTTDTVKEANGDGMVLRTLDRDRVWQIGTPQVFDANLYRAAAYTAAKEKFEATDDCALVEHVGHTVKLIDVGRENIKITYPDDIAYAELLLDKRAKTM